PNNLDHSSFPTRRSSDLNGNFRFHIKSSDHVRLRYRNHLYIQCLPALLPDPALKHNSPPSLQIVIQYRSCRGGSVHSALSGRGGDRKSTRLNSIHVKISY